MPHLSAITESELWKLMEEDAVLVTVNRRLARYLTGRFNVRNMDAGLTVWETPDILPFSSWLQRVYDQVFYLGPENVSADLKVLLSPAQELIVWEQVINSSASGNALLRIPETAKAAMQAWEICKEWRLPFYEISQAPPEDTAAFLEWAQAFEQKCRDKRWLDNAGLADAVSGLFKSSSISAPRQMIMAGFDELSPCWMSLIKGLADIGCGVFEFGSPADSSSSGRCGSADRQTEITAAARWARARLEENPQVRIGVIVPGLEAVRPSMIRIFDDVFHPSMLISPKSEKDRVYNISLGLPLSDYPVVSAAQMILDFACRPLHVKDYSRLLLSPFLGGAEDESSERAMLDARIRANGEVEIPVSGLIYFSAEHQSRKYHPGVYCPILNERLRYFERAQSKLKDRRLPSEWAKAFSGLLQSIGWPGDRGLTSEEWQAGNALNEALSQFASLDAVCGKSDMDSALSRLKQMLEATTFQPETKDVPVQMMGMLEAVGERFDQMWIMGMDAESWPPEPRPNPFLPVWLQKKYNVAHASPEREFAFADRVTRRLLTSADNVMVSYPLKDGDTVLCPSPLIAHLDPVESDQQGENWQEKMFETAAFENVKDQHGPAADARTRISGGTGLLKLQASCPFSAFAAYRLKAEALEMPESGLNARQRGSLVHNALEFFWEETKTQDALIKMPETDVTVSVEHAVNKAVSAMTSRHPRAFADKGRFLELERQRLVLLVLEFLEADRMRLRFTVIDREKKLLCTVADIELKTYADRIDRLDDGKLVIVDYKTGEPSVADWFTERIAEPQLPLYSFAVKEEVAGVVFAQIKKGNIKYLGVAEKEGIIPGAGWPGAKKSPMESYSTIQEIINSWQGKIEILADEVRQGLAAVAPVSVLKSCRYCDFGPMCRIGEIDFL